MILEFEKAFETVINSAHICGTERVCLDESLGRVLAEAVVSDVDSPPFNKSAMDGYACRRSDLGEELEVIELIPAGKNPEKTISAGQCSKIMTGAVVPEGVDVVFMKEYVQECGEGKVRFVGEKTRDNICIKGEDVLAGDEVLSKGSIIRPEQTAVLASVGCVRPLVYSRPRVGVIATGNELVCPDEKPNMCQIRNSNGYQIAAQAARVGGKVRNYGIAIDTIEGIGEAFKKAARENDVVIVSGGVSVGDFDLVPGVMKDNGFKLMFENIALKPGKHAVFGVKDGTYCFGLPGNPVSTYVVFDLLVKPFLYKLMGCDWQQKTISVILEEGIKRKKTERDCWVPVSFTENGGVKSIDYHGSAHIHALCHGDGLICMPVGVGEIEKDSAVKIRLI
jgi:molybdopterin molybdotransferase